MELDPSTVDANKLVTDAMADAPDVAESERCSRSDPTRFVIDATCIGTVNENLAIAGKLTKRTKIINSRDRSAGVEWVKSLPKFAKELCAAPAMANRSW